MASADEEGNNTFNTVKDIIQYLTASFGNRDAIVTVKRKLYKLRQGKRDFSHYLTNDNRINGKLKYDEKAKHDGLEHEMKKEFKDAMNNVFEDQSTFAKYFALLLTIDNRLNA